MYRILDKPLRVPNGMRVLVFGTFDLLHAGHVSLFAQARSLGSDDDPVELHAVIARDATVEKVKGRAPDHDERERLRRVSDYVDSAHLGSLGDKYAIIEVVEPDVIALGYDQTHFLDKLPEELEKRGLHPRIVRLEAHEPDRFKTSLLRDQRS